MRLAVIDDHDLLLGAVSVAIRAMEGEFVPHEFEALEAYDEAVAAGSRFDLVLLDLGLPGYSDLAALRYFRQWHDDTPVVVISATHDRDTILRSLDLGAMGFIPKTAKRLVFQAAISLVANGGIYIPKEALVPETQQDAAAAFELASVEPSKGPGSAAVSYDTGLAAAIAALTPRQHDVLAMLLKGLPNKLICRELGLSPNTVKTHVGAIFRALEVDSRTKAVLRVARGQLEGRPSALAGKR